PPTAGLYARVRKSLQIPECVVADAVGIEPVCTSKFPTTGKLSGNFSEKRAQRPNNEQLPPVLQRLTGKFPMLWKRELRRHIWEYATELAGAGNSVSQRLGIELVCGRGRGADRGTRGFAGSVWQRNIMPYTPQWERLDDAVTWIMKSGLTEQKAQRDLCRAMAEGAVAVRLIIPADRIGPSQALSGGDYPAPATLSPEHIDWHESRPLRWDQPAQRPGEPVSLYWQRAGALCDRTIQLVEVMTSDVRKVFAESAESPEVELPPDLTTPTPAEGAKTRATKEAIKALWPDGIPDTCLIKARDDKIIEWCRENGRPPPTRRTIQRTLKDQ
ncbi:MAG TPA: hypothetical protein VHX39_27015, partial [Acetobacteraceae bacterium]|nr:hypothetical protein [Acetobacteraceae bacterium]